VTKRYQSTLLELGKQILQKYGWQKNKQGDHRRKDPRNFLAALHRHPHFSGSSD